MQEVPQRFFELPKELGISERHFVGGIDANEWFGWRRIGGVIWRFPYLNPRPVVFLSAPSRRSNSSAVLSSEAVT